MPKLVAIGETIIDLIATEPVSYEEAAAFQKCFGGAPMNTAVGAAKLGVETGVVTAVGGDPLGRFAVETLRRNGVDVTHVKVKDKLRTTISFVANEPETGERTFFFYRKPWCETADSALLPGDVPKAYLASAKVVHVSGFALSQEPSRSTILQALKEAKGAGAKISFDPTLRLDVWGSRGEMRQVYREALGLADVASFSTEEAEEILGSGEPREAASRAFEMGVGLVGLKRGAEGSVLASKGGEYYEAPAFKVKPVDTTGAGDAWNAGLLAGLIEGKDLRACALVANAAGAIVVTARGAITAMPTRGELKRFLEDRGLKLL